MDDFIVGPQCEEMEESYIFERYGYPEYENEEEYLHCKKVCKLPLSEDASHDYD